MGVVGGGFLFFSVLYLYVRSDTLKASCFEPHTNSYKVGQVEIKNNGTIYCLY